MIIIWGQQLYGRTDKVPGDFYVATQFFHLWYIPLIPLGSWVIVEGSENGNGWRGVRCGLSFKSWLFAWARTACVLVTLGCLLGLFIEISEGRPNWWQPLVFAATAIAGWFFLNMFEKASLRRALTLAEKLGYAEIHLQQLEERFLGPGLASNALDRSNRKTQEEEDVFLRD